MPPRTNGVDGRLATLKGPVVQAILTFADDRALRRDVYTAYNTRASDQGPDAGRHDNSTRIGQILALRHEAARLAGLCVQRPPVPGRQDGRHAGARARFPARTGGQGAAGRRARAGDAARVRRQRAWHRRPAGLGPVLRQREAARAPLRVLAKKTSSRISPCPRCCRGLFDRDPARVRRAPGRTPRCRDLASGRAVSSTSSMPTAACAPASISIISPAAASAAAPGWMSAARRSTTRRGRACPSRS